MFRIISTLSLALFSFAALAHSTAPVASADQAGPSLQIAQVVQEEAIVEEQAGEEAQPAAAPGAPAGGVSSGQVDRPLVIVGGAVLLGGLIAAAASSGGGGSSTPGHTPAPSHN